MSVHKDEERGTYFFIVRVPDGEGGTRQVKRRGFKTRQKAVKAEAEVILNAEEYEEENPTFEFIADKYLGWYKKRRKESSYNKIESIVRIHLKPKFGKKRLMKIRNRDISNYHDDLLEKYSVRHTKKIHDVLSAIFNYAIKQEYTNNNPARNVGNVDIQEEKHVNYWTLEEFKQFLSVVDDDMYRTLFMTLYYSGLRKGELLALTWADIDFDNNTINVDKRVYAGNVDTPKTPSSIRKILMPKLVMQLLKNLKNTTKPKTGYVVFGEVYDHLSETTLDRHYHVYLKESQVKAIRLHDFRHSHASYLINKGAIISVIAQRLGHSDVASTLNTYSHLYPTTEKEAVLKMEDDFKIADVVQLRVK